MSRKMIDANRKVFERLGQIVQDTVHSSVLAYKRAITTDASEKNWLQNVKFEFSSNIALGPAAFFAIGRLSDECYLIAAGVEIDDPPQDFTEIAMNAGLFTAIVAELPVPIVRPKSIKNDLIDKVFVEFQPLVEPIKYDFREIAGYFANIQIFKISPDSPLLIGDAETFSLKIGIAAVLGSTAAMPLSWPRPSKERLQSLAREPKNWIPLHLVFRAVTEFRTDAAFLAVYRCLEQLFPLSMLGALSQELEVEELSLLDIATSLEKHLGWRRKEDDAIAGLFAEIDTTHPDLIQQMATLLGDIKIDELAAKVVSQRIYDIRNQCVHFRPFHSHRSKLPELLPIIGMMIEINYILYVNHAKDFEINLASSPETTSSKGISSH